MRVCVLIPTYNNAGTIEAVVRDALRECPDVIVVNDGSTDRTSEILHAIEGITLLEYVKNRGKGYALLCGFRRAVEMGFTHAITMDGDGQHYASDIGKFLKAHRQHPDAMILGRRHMEHVQRSKGSIFANHFSNFWVFVQTGHRLPDTQTGFRLYPLHIPHFSFLTSHSSLLTRYECEVALLVLALWQGVEVISIDIDVYYPPSHERVSHFRPGMDFARISVLNTVLCLLAVVYGWPLRIWRWLACAVRTIYALLIFLFICLCVLQPAAWILGKRKMASPHAQRENERNLRRLHLLIYHAMRFVVLRHGIPGTSFSWQVSEKVDFGKPSVIICNHQSHLDLACQLICTPNMVFLTNDWVWNSRLYGLLVRNAECYPVSMGIDKLMPRLRSLVERGYSIALYPEGTRSIDCRIGRFHKGAFYIAQQLGLDIIPMYLDGPGKVLPKKTYHLNKGRIHMEVGVPFTQSQLQQMGDIKAQASMMRKHYKKTLNYEL